LDPECEGGNLGSAGVVSVGKSGQSSQTISEEAKVIHEVPSVADVTEMHGLDRAKHVHESSAPRSGTATGRKRRVDGSSAPLNDAMLLNDEKINKRRRQENIDDVTPPKWYYSLP